MTSMLSHPAALATYLPLEPVDQDLRVPLDPVDPTVPLHERRPPPSLWSVTADYDEGVERHVRAIVGALAALDVSTADLGKVLDFGCGTGRLLLGLHQHLPGDDRELWGVDIHAARIEWARRNLSPTLRFSTCSTFPHLPFEDRTFDLIVAGSVFTHIPDLADAWLLELLRVTAPGGMLYLTIQDQSWLQATLDRPDEDWLSEFLAGSTVDLGGLGTDSSMIVIGRSRADAMVLHDRDALVDLWSSYAEVCAVVEHGYDAQTAIILRKEPSPRPLGRRGRPRVLELDPPGRPARAELLGLPLVHLGPTDDGRARAVLAEQAPGIEPHWFTVDTGGRICEVSEGAAEAVGLTETTLLGSSPPEAQERIADALGPLLDPTVIEADDDLIVQALTYGETRVIQANAALRDDAGGILAVRVLFCPTSS